MRAPTDAERRERPRGYYAFVDAEAGALEYASDADGFAAATARLLALVNEDKEGFDAVCGFSQGGEVALLLASRAHEFTHALRRPYRFACFGAELPLVLHNAPRVDFGRARRAPSRPPGALRCFAVMGDEDVDNGRGFAEAVEQIRARGLPIESATWPGDHRMPPKGAPCYDAMVRFLFPTAEPVAPPAPAPAPAPTPTPAPASASAPPPPPADDDDDDALAALGF